MIKSYPPPIVFLTLCASLILFIASCKKDNSQTPGVATPKKIGFYEVIDSGKYRKLIIKVSKIGTVNTTYGLVFDTGSGGMVLDATGVVPASMITSSGFNFTGDSTVIDGITITNQTSVVTYGDDNNTINKVYGNLAYASVTVGDANGNIVITRLPFFLYYKAVDSQGNLRNSHVFDVFGVSSEYDIFFSNGMYTTSPFTYYDPGNGLTRGFKISALGSANFSAGNGTYEPALTLGLTQADLNSSGFLMTALPFVNGGGYIPIIVGTIGYANQNIPAEMLFDTGTEPYSFIEDPNWPYGAGTLVPNTEITIETSAGFNWQYNVSATDNLTVIENPASSGSYLSVMGIDFFMQNEYLLDLTHYQVGLKNN